MEESVKETDPKSRDIRYSIKSSDSPFVICRLAPGVQMIAEPGAMMLMDDGIVTKTVFGDGSSSEPAILRFFKAMKRPFSGESMVTVIYTNSSDKPGDVYFAAPFPGTIIPLQLSEFGGSLICQRGAYFCGSRGIKLSIAFQKRIRAGLFGGEGFIMQRIEGDGLVFLHTGGTLAERTLGPGEELSVDTGCIAALQKTVTYDIKRAGSFGTMLFGGEGIFLAKLRGPGRVWLQSLPIRRLSASIVSNSVLGGGQGMGGKLYLVFIVIIVLISLFTGSGNPN